MWPPITLEKITTMIGYVPFFLNEEQLKLWDFIKLTPQKWQEHTMGEEGGGFWVVAIAGNNAIYYNDIEEGFNISSYSQYGILDEYGCNQSELHDLIIN